MTIIPAWELIPVLISMGYSIISALESNCFENVFVSTDSPEYAKIAREYGVETPFLRSAEMSTDHAGS